MKFDVFQSHCKYAQWGIKEGYSYTFELTCRRADRIPKGHSWGKCDALHCPHFGLEIKSGTMIDKTNGEVLMNFNGGQMVFNNEEP